MKVAAHRLEPHVTLNQRASLEIVLNSQMLRTWVAAIKLLFIFREAKLYSDKDPWTEMQSASFPFPIPFPHCPSARVSCQSDSVLTTECSYSAVLSLSLSSSAIHPCTGAAVPWGGSSYSIILLNHRHCLAPGKPLHRKCPIHQDASLNTRASCWG